MADIPLLLLGPILRRVEPRHVAVFVATHQPANVRVLLYDGQVDAESPPPELAVKETHTTRFASGFHAIVVTVDFADAAALQPGHQYSYDIRITPDGGVPQSLKDLKLLEDDKLDGYGKADPAGQKVEVDAIGYADNRLPSFVTCPASLDELVLAHASCRKPHGDGHPALQWLDSYIDDLHGAVAGRPHMLFLTGDQIYADDVASALMPGLTALGIALLDGVEEVPSPVDNNAKVKVNTTELPAGFRQRVTGKSGFTSDWAASHLIGFGEFLAMYCAAWNPYLWPLLAVADTSDPALGDDLKARLVKDAQNLKPGDEQTAPVVLGRPSPDAPADAVTPLYGGTQPEADALEKARREFLAAKGLLDEFRREVPKVRRLLANVPTYMICDDHDVTDDWFMTGEIRRATTKNLFGQALVRNALAAHTICQAWGNVPQLWTDDDDHRILLEGISGLFPEGWDGGPADVDGANAVVTTLGLTPTGEPLFDFSFSVDGPMHKVRVLDTRTRREYNTPKSPPGLLSLAALDTQLPLQELEQLPDGHPLIVVSPAPVFGPPLLSDIGGPILVTKHDLFSIAWSESERALDEQVTGLEYGTPAGLQYYDIEFWGAHPAAFERLLERLSRHPRVIVLGGDVHYGAAYAMDWTGNGRTGRIVHFTSSAAKNDWKDSADKLGAPGVVHNLFALNGLATGLQNIGFPMTRLGWSATLPPVVTNLEKEPPSTRLRVQTGPVVLSNEHFRELHALTRPPDWVWRAAPIVDVRAPADRPPAARVPEPAADLPQDGGAVHQYGALAAMHVQALRTAAVARGLQFLNNVGLITFATSGDGIHVSQALYSLRSREDPNEKGDAYVIYETLLEPVPVPVPNAVGAGA
ncbi:MAG: hypothetical protein WAQ33_10995 [Gaiellaceae bacterium]